LKKKIGKGCGLKKKPSQAEKLGWAFYLDLAIKIERRAK